MDTKTKDELKYILQFNNIEFKTNMNKDELKQLIKKNKLSTNVPTKNTLNRKEQEPKIYMINKVSNNNFKQQLFEHKQNNKPNITIPEPNKIVHHKQENKIQPQNNNHLDNMVKILQIKCNELNLYLNSGSNISDSDNRKLSIWSTNRMPCILKTINGFTYLTFNNLFLSWSSGFQSLDNNRKWCVWSENNDTPIEVIVSGNNVLIRMINEPKLYLSWSSGFTQLNNGHKYAVWDQTGIPINTRN